MKLSKFSVVFLMLISFSVVMVWTGGQSGATAEGKIKIGIAGQTMKEAVYPDMKAAAMAKGEDPLI